MHFISINALFIFSCFVGLGRLWGGVDRSAGMHCVCVSTSASNCSVVLGRLWGGVDRSAGMHCGCVSTKASNWFVGFGSLWEEAVDPSPHLRYIVAFAVHGPALPARFFCAFRSQAHGCSRAVGVMLCQLHTCSDM